MTIVEAIQRVLEIYKKPLTYKQIYEYIIQNNFYNFKAEKPEHIVKTTLRRHCFDLNHETSKEIKYFKIVKNDRVNSTYQLYQGINRVIKQDNFLLSKESKNITYFVLIIKIIGFKAIPINQASFFIGKELLKQNIDEREIESYLDSLEKLNFIQSINESYILTKSSKWFLELENYFDSRSLFPLSQEKNKLSFLEKYLILKSIIKEDFITLYDLLELVPIKHYVEIKDIVDTFISKNRESYVDNILNNFSLRIEWLKSLEILEKDNQIKFTEKGNIFFNSLSKQLIVFKDKSITINTFLLTDFVKSFAKYNNMKLERTNKIDIYIKKYFEQCFKIHQSRFNKRVTISSLINSIIILTMIEDKIAMEYIDIKSILVNTNFIKNKGYSFNYSIKEEDRFP